MRRREFIGIVGGATAAWPFGAYAQQAEMPVVGILGSGSPQSQQLALAAFLRGLGDGGYADGRNVIVDARWSDSRPDRMAAIAAEFAKRQVALIATFGGLLTARAARAATSNLPVVFLIGPDPVAAGLVASMNCPDGNLTGISTLTVGLAAKRLELAREIVPGLQTVAVLVNPANPTAAIPTADETVKAAALLGMKAVAVRASSDEELRPAFEAMVRERAGAILVGGDQFHLSRRQAIVELAMRHRIAGAYYSREYAMVGGLVSYGADISDSYRQIGRYAARILSGVKPSELPILQPTKFELVVNLKTARALGIDVPPNLIARADEVIE